MPDSWPLRHRRRAWSVPVEDDIDKDDPTRCPCGRLATTSVVTASGVWPVCSGCVTVFRRYTGVGIEVAQAQDDAS
jgi:hypothetical protein